LSGLLDEFDGEQIVEMFSVGRFDRSDDSEYK
jgi:hypothetical protein